MFRYDTEKLITEVCRCEPVEGGYDVLLRETVLYAESGGQPSDRGTVAGMPVLRLWKDEAGEIHHLLPQPVEGTVEVCCDPLLRHQHSLLHTAQHLVSAVFDRIGSETSSFHIAADNFSIDLSHEHTREELDEQERTINRFIWEDLPVTERLYDPARDGDIPLPHGVDPAKARLICIGEIDRNPCGGTHLTHTGALGLVKIIHLKPSRGGTRIWVMAGEDALRWVQKTCDRDAAMRALINVEEGRELAVLENKLKEHKKMSKEIKKLQKQLDQQAAQG